MRSTALAYKDEYDEVPVSSPETLETSVVALRADFTDFRIEARAAITRIDQEIRNAISRLESEIRGMVKQAESDLNHFSTRVETQLSTIRAEGLSLRDKTDKAYERLDDKIDRV